MSDSPTFSDVADFSLDAWKTATNCETQLAASAIAWNTHVMDMVEKRVKVSRDITEIQAIQAALVTYHRANMELESERRQFARRAEHVTNAVNHAAWVFRGETINPDVVRDVWVGIRYLVGQADVAGAAAEINRVAVGPDAYDATSWFHVRACEFMCLTYPGVNVRQTIERAAINSCMPRCGSPAMAVFERLFSVLQKHAESRLSGLHVRATDLQRELLELRRQSWSTIDYSAAPKGKQ
jgi:hypothetical protein